MVILKVKSETCIACHLTEREGGVERENEGERGRERTRGEREVEIERERDFYWRKCDGVKKTSKYFFVQINLWLFLNHINTALVYRISDVQCSPSRC